MPGSSGPTRPERNSDSPPTLDAPNPAPWKASQKLSVLKRPVAARASLMAMESDVACECPRHVSELIVALNQFEDYSNDCVNQTDQDAARIVNMHLTLTDEDGRALAVVILER